MKDGFSMIRFNGPQGHRDCRAYSWSFSGEDNTGWVMGMKGNWSWATNNSFSRSDPIDWHVLEIIQQAWDLGKLRNLIPEPFWVAFPLFRLVSSLIDFLPLLSKQQLFKVYRFVFRASGDGGGLFSSEDMMQHSGRLQIRQCHALGEGGTSRGSLSSWPESLAWLA